MSESERDAEPGDKNKMVKELKELDLFEYGMAVEEMKHILTAIKLSQKPTNGDGGNNNVNKSPEVIRQDNQPCHSRGLNSKNSERGSMSPELSGSQMRKSLSQEKRGESGDETMHLPHTRNSFGKENKDVQPANMNKSRLSINENFPEVMDNNKQSGQRTKSLMRNHETPKNMVNPLDVVMNTKDIRLQPLYRTLPEKDYAEGGNCVSIDKALPRLMKHLHHNAILWHSQQGTSVRSKIPWGKAIQVDTEHASQDKECFSDTAWPIAGPSGANINLNNDRGRRACARKIIDYTTGEVSGSNSDNDFDETSTSEKVKTTKRATHSEKTNLQRDRTENTRKRRNPVDKDDIYGWNEEQMSETEEEKEDETKNVKRKKFSEEASSSENANTAEERVTSESTRSRKNIPEEPANSLWESIIDEDDEDSDEESKKIAKKKKPAKPRAPAKRVTPSRARRQKSVEPSTSHEDERENDDAMVCIEDSDEISISDRESKSEALRKAQRNRNEEAVSSTSSSSYPRRIVPPNPKGKYAGIRARKPLLDFCDRARTEKRLEEHERANAEDTRANRQNRSNSGLSQSEIVDVSEADDEKQVIPVPRDFEIRPLRVSDRMKWQQEHLKHLRKQEEQLKFQRAEELRIKETIAQREKEEKIRQRLKEEKQKERLREQAAKARIESEKRWNSMLNQQKKRQVGRTELNPEGPRQNSDAPSVLMEDNCFETSHQNDVELVDDERRTEQRVACPICGKKFMPKLIEDHAASCEEYDATTTPEASRSSSPVISTRPATSMRRGNSKKLYECHVCSSFSSHDGRKFEDHVNKCVTRHRDGVDIAPSAVIDVPDSPIRNLQKASELADTNINYRQQFVPKTKSQLNDNRKRKRL